MIFWWNMKDFDFFIMYHPWLDVHSHSQLTITNRFLSLLFHVDVVEQIRLWVIIILHQLFLNQTIDSYPITWWSSVFYSLIYFLLSYSSLVITMWNVGGTNQVIIISVFFTFIQKLMHQINFFWTKLLNIAQLHVDFPFFFFDFVPKRKKKLSWFVIFFSPFFFHVYCFWFFDLFLIKL